MLTSWGLVMTSHHVLAVQALVVVVEQYCTVLQFCGSFVYSEYSVLEYSSNSDLVIKQLLEYSHLPLGAMGLDAWSH
jgi:hypothetical protein